MSHHQTLRVDVDDRGVATITMDRPEVRNAFNDTLIGEMTAVAQQLAADDAVRVVVLTGGGPVFSAGADLTWMGGMREYSEEENVADSRRMNAMFRALWDLPKPLVGRVNGHAIAGGTGLVAVCDVVVAVEGAKLGLTEVVLGLAPAVISPYVTRKIGLSHARALFLTGELFDATRAHHVGLVHRLVPDVEALDTAVAETVAQLLKGAPGAHAVAKTIPARALADLDEATAAMPHVIAALRVGEEGQEGIAAFFDKRPAAWVPTTPPTGSH